MDCIIICSVESGQISILTSSKGMSQQRETFSGSRLPLEHRSVRHNLLLQVPCINDSAETTVVEEGQSQIVGSLLTTKLTTKWELTSSCPSNNICPLTKLDGGHRRVCRQLADAQSIQ